MKRTTGAIGIGAAAAWAAVTLAACASPTRELSLASPDRARFEVEAYPVLLRDCSFHACHGTVDRFFQVFGPGRTRLSPAAGLLDPVDVLEVGRTYDRARSMIDSAHPEDSLLLRKPLAVAAGGAGHEGTDAFGRDVYESETEPGFVALRNWALGSAPGAAGPSSATPGIVVDSDEAAR